jgi:hypothetical protein
LAGFNLGQLIGKVSEIEIQVGVCRFFRLAAEELPGVSVRDCCKAVLLQNLEKPVGV